MTAKLADFGFSMELPKVSKGKGIHCSSHYQVGGILSIIIIIISGHFSEKNQKQDRLSSSITPVVKPEMDIFITRNFSETEQKALVEKSSRKKLDGYCR